MRPRFPGWRVHRSRLGAVHRGVAQRRAGEHAGPRGGSAMVKLQLQGRSVHLPLANHLANDLGHEAGVFGFLHHRLDVLAERGAFLVQVARAT